MAILKKIITGILMVLCTNNVLMGMAQPNIQSNAPQANSVAPKINYYTSAKNWFLTSSATAVVGVGAYLFLNRSLEQAATAAPITDLLPSNASENLRKYAENYGANRVKSLAHDIAIAVPSYAAISLGCLCYSAYQFAQYLWETKTING